MDSIPLDTGRNASPFCATPARASRASDFFRGSPISPATLLSLAELPLDALAGEDLPESIQNQLDADLEGNWGKWSGVEAEPGREATRARNLRARVAADSLGARAVGVLLTTIVPGSPGTAVRPFARTLGMLKD